MPAEPPTPDPNLDPNLDPLRLWQSQTREPLPMTVADIRAHALSFEGKVRRNVLRETISSVLVVLIFGWYALQPWGWMMRSGSVLVILATLWVTWELRRRAARQRGLTDDAGALVDAYRAALTRSRDNIRSMAVWYLAPFVPGIVLIIAGRWLQSPLPHVPRGADHTIILLVSLIVALVFGVIWLLNQRRGDRIQRMIDELTP